MKIKILLLGIVIACSARLVKAQAVIEKDCSQQHTGSYCFHNASKNTLQVKVSYCYMPAGSVYPAFKTMPAEFTLKPGESKYLNDVMSSPGVRNNFVAKKDGRQEIVDQGDFIINQCTTRRHDIK